MNKWEKEVMQRQLTAEQAVIKELETQYKRALKEINLKIRILKGDELTQSKIYQINYQEALKGQIEGILEKLHGDEFTSIQEYLKECYTDGFIGTMYDIAGQGIPLMIPIDQNAAAKAIITDSKINEGLYKAIGVDTAELKKRIRSEITRGLAANDTYESIAQSISLFTNAPLARARTIVRTEGHRIQQASCEDARQAAKKRGCDILKVWDATMDGNTRPSHRQMDGQIRETNEPFKYGNKKAMYPGAFNDPAEDCNCRCTANSIPRWALDEAELEEQKERAKFFGIDKTKDFEDYKEKYLKAVENPKEYNMVRASRLEANGLFVNKTEKLHRYAKNIQPIDGYEDFTCHADADSFYIDLGGKGKEEDFFKLTPEEYAERIKASNTYKGGNIRIISCQAGAKKDGAAQRLADALNVAVYAPTETVHVTENGEIFISDNDILAEMWYNESDRSVIKETGTWKLFKPRKE